MPCWDVAVVDGKLNVHMEDVGDRPVALLTICGRT